MNAWTGSGLPGALLQVSLARTPPVPADGLRVPAVLTRLGLMVHASTPERRRHRRRVCSWGGAQDRKRRTAAIASLARKLVDACGPNLVVMPLDVVITRCCAPDRDRGARFSETAVAA